jgi:hypothetical protein
VFIEGGGSQLHMTVDTSRGVEHNKEETTSWQDGSVTVDAVLHRPLKTARPWSFGFRGVCPEFYGPTEGRCVPPQLAAALQKQFNLQVSDVDWLFDAVFDQLYPPGAADNPYEIDARNGSIERCNWRNDGIATAMILKFSESHRVSDHVLWAETKITSYTLADSPTSVCLYVWGDRAFMVDYLRAKSAIAQSKSIKPRLRPGVILKIMTKCEDPPASEWLEWSGGEVIPDHFHASDLARARFECRAQRCS